MSAAFSTLTITIPIPLAFPEGTPADDQAEALFTAIQSISVSLDTSSTHPANFPPIMGALTATLAVLNECFRSQYCAHYPSTPTHNSTDRYEQGFSLGEALFKSEGPTISMRFKPSPT